jgi:hypothetical protein
MRNILVIGICLVAVYGVDRLYWDGAFAAAFFGMLHHMIVAYK